MVKKYPLLYVCSVDHSGDRIGWFGLVILKDAAHTVTPYLLASVDQGNSKNECTIPNSCLKFMQFLDMCFGHVFTCKPFSDRNGT